MRVREFSSVPIIMVTARGKDQDKIHGLDLGADDYLAKPLSVEELLARVRSVLRRSQFGATGPDDWIDARTVYARSMPAVSHHRTVVNTHGRMHGPVPHTAR
jgi:DNA-binding response OmpR family regulator